MSKKVCPIMSIGLREGYDMDHWSDVHCNEECGFFDSAVQQCSLVSIAGALRNIDAQTHNIDMAIRSGR